MRKWKRVDTADGARFRSTLAAHESALLKSLVTSLLEMLEGRESSSPTDELEELTGMKTGHSTPPEDDTMKRLLPDFYKSQTDHPAGSGTAESLNGALRSLHEPTIIDAKRQAAQRLLDTLPVGGGKFEITEADAHCWAAAVNDVRLALGHHARKSVPTAPTGCRRTSDGRTSGRLSMADGASGVPGVGLMGKPAR